MTGDRRRLVALKAFGVACHRKPVSICERFTRQQRVEAVCKSLEPIRLRLAKLSQFDNV